MQQQDKHQQTAQSIQGRIFFSLLFFTSKKHRFFILFTKYSISYYLLIYKDFIKSLLVGNADRLGESENETY